MVDPLCPYFGSCGGCSSQHIAYEAQLEWKRKKVASATGLVDVFVSHGPQYGYRNRMDFFLSEDAIGLRRKSGGIMDVANCPISQEPINALLSEVREAFGKAERKPFQSIIIRPSCVVFVLDAHSSKLASAIDLITSFSKTTSAAHVVISYAGEPPFALKGETSLSHRFLGKPFLFPADGFFQNNPVVAESMHAYCRKLLRAYDTRQASLLDLYGGVGCFGINNADLFKDVLIVEESAPSIACAQRNIEQNGARNAKALVLDAKRIGRLSFAAGSCVILDPPRSGMDQKTIDALKAFKPSLIIYISCNIEQLAKDLPKFKHYTVKSAALFDMFPNTPHIETVVELVRS